MRKILLGTLALVALAALPAAAQCTLPTTAPPVDNPGGVQWCPSADHATVDSYEVDIVRADGSLVQTLNVGKPAISAIDGSCSAAINVQPIAFSSGYRMLMHAKAGTAISANTPSINSFNRVPGGPAKVIIKAPEPEANQ